MKHLIDKSAIVAEIKKIKSYIGSDKYLSDFEMGCNFGREDVCDSLLNFIDTLEVKEIKEESARNELKKESYWENRYKEVLKQFKEKVE